MTSRDRPPWSMKSNALFLGLLSCFDIGLSWIKSCYLCIPQKMLTDSQDLHLQEPKICKYHTVFHIMPTKRL